MFWKKARRVGCSVLAVPCTVLTVILTVLGPLPPPPVMIRGAQAFAADFQKGVSYEAAQRGDFASANSDQTLSQLIAPLGVNWIAIIVRCFQEAPTSTEISCGSNKATAS